MKKILLAGMLLCLVSSTALAATGLNFYWTPDGKCPAVPASYINQAYDCLTNDGGSWKMVGSFQLPAALPQFYGIEVIIDGQSVGPVPAWWQSFNDGSCRANAFYPSVSMLAQTSPCTKLWPVAPSGGFGAWQTADYPPPTGNVPLPNRLRIKLAYVMATTRVNLLATKVYNAFNVNMDATNSAEDLSDPGNPIYACAGCLVPVTLVLNQINALADPLVTVEMTAQLVNRCITWQGGASPSECGATPARNTTWGNVKSLYR